MDNHLDLKYRPRTLGEVVGHPEMVRSLTRQAETQRYGKAYLLAGHRGTGKTTMARLIASLVNCQHRQGGIVCGTCRPCQLIHEGHCPDVFEIDAAGDNGVENARLIKERANYAPQEMTHKFYILNEAQGLTVPAMRALLTVVEEPPQFVTFIFTTTDPIKLLPEIRSRCRSYRFLPLPGPLIAQRVAEVAVKEGMALEPAAATGIARLAQGCLRDALNYLEEAGVANSGPITPATLQELFGLPERRIAIDLVRMVNERNPSAVLLAADDLIHHGADVRSVLLEVSEVFRSALLMEAGADRLVTATTEEKELIRQSLNKVSRACLVNIAKTLGRIDKEIKENINPRLVMEAALLHCISIVATDAARNRPPT